MSEAASALCVFARPVIAGAVKTRLSPALGAAGAAALYAAFLRDTLALLANIGDCDRTLWVAGDPDHPSLRECHLRRRAQPRGDLGVRLQLALEDGLDRAPRALALGSDAPTLPAGHVRRALAALEDADVVLGPTADGGYYALGVRRQARQALPGLLRGVRWSSPHTLADTLALTARAGLTAALVEPFYDVDEPADLALLRLHLSLDPAVAPATRAALARQIRF